MYIFLDTQLLVDIPLSQVDPFLCLLYVSFFHSGTILNPKAFHFLLRPIGSKDSTWEGGIRVPALARWPGTIAPGSHSQAIISSMDIFATAAGMSGGKLPQDRIMDSESFLPVLTGATMEHREVLLHYCSDRLMAVTYGVFKAHLYTKPSMNLDQLAAKCRKGWTPTGSYHLCFSCDPPCAVYHDPPLLYNIGFDPSELSPLNVRKHVDVLREINRIVEEHERTLVKGDPLFVREIVSSLNPCCNPPYCMCNYDRTLYLRELGLS